MERHVHIICRRVDNSAHDGLTRLTRFGARSDSRYPDRIQARNVYMSEAWALSEEVGNRLVGAVCCFHETQATASTFAMRITHCSLSHETWGPHDKPRIILFGTFEPSGIGLPWGGQTGP